MKIKRYIVAMGVMLFCIGGIKGQSLEESLTVEGTYTPEVIAADRLSATPTTVTLTAPESSLNYDRRGVTANFAPDALAMPATGWRTAKEFNTSRGYLDLSLGSWLNASLSAGYAAIRNEDTKLNVWLRHNSTSLWRAWEADPENGIEAASRRFRYDERIGADFRHRFGNAGILTADAQYHFGYFNYYGSKYKLIDKNDGKAKAPAQNLNDVYVHARWDSKPTERLAYAVDADVRYFGFKHGYYATWFSPYINFVDAGRETTFNIKTDMSYSFSKSDMLAVGLQYSGVYNQAYGPDLNCVRLLPSYIYTHGNSSLRIGAELALTMTPSVENFNGDLPPRHYTKTRFRIAPDIKFTWRKNSMAFSAAVGGGTYYRTLAWMYLMDIYTDPAYGCYNATYSPIDARMALQYNPGGKFTIGIDGIWTTLINQPFGGTFQTLLNFTKPEHNVYLQNHIHGFSIGVNVGYDFSRYFGLKGNFHWQPQNGTAGFLNGFDRPEITANISATSKPIDALSLSLDYNLRAKRYLLHGNISRLNFSANYQINKKLSLGVDLCNLLNRHEMLLPDLPTEGFTAAGRVQIKF